MTKQVREGTIESHGNGGMSFTGGGVEIFRATSIASGLRLYAKTGMKPNRMWSPTAMLDAASNITGVKYKRGQYDQAADDLQKWAIEARAKMAAPQ